MTSIPGFRFAPLLLLLGGLALLPSGVRAQDGYLFGRPRFDLALGVGYDQARAASALFDFTSDQLTIPRRGYGGSAGRLDLAWTLSPRWSLVLGFGGSEAVIPSEFRDWIGSDDLPVEQTTTFSRQPAVLGARWYLLERGRSISRFAWVPGRWTAFFGGGAGMVSWSFRQEGEWVDYRTLEIFREDFEATGTAPYFELSAGGEWSLGPRWFLRAEARQGWARDGLGRDFVDFDQIDLAGSGAQIGAGIRF